jgi:aminoglycoside 6'-N-acetyltransferase I
MNIRPVTRADRDEWLRMRSALWPDAPLVEHNREIEQFLETGQPGVVLVAERPQGELCGFLEARVRHYVDGCETDRVGYIEGWYVDPDLRRNGIGRAMVKQAEHWARHHGCTEMASDTQLYNMSSQEAHLRIGYTEVERLVIFRKEL